MSVRHLFIGSVLLACLGAVRPVAAAPDDTTDRARRRTPVVEVFEASRDAVVSISSTEIVTVRSRSPFNSFFDDHFHVPRQRRQRVNSVGSGFVIHPDGYVVTNAHVIARTVERKVIFANGDVYDAQIVASDAARDLAVLKIEADRPLPILPLGRSDDLMVGETVVAIGNPLGYQHTVTAGVISAVERDIEISRELTFTDLIQTDASINPGNSGGPLLNVLGELIGVNSAIRGDAENIGFAIPVDQLRELLPSLLDVERRYGLDSGLVVDSVMEEPRVKTVRADSPAASAGIAPGDVLVAIGGRPVREGIDFDIALIDRQPSDAMDLTFQRDGETYQTRLRLAARRAPDARSLVWEKLGIACRTVTRAERRRRVSGVLIDSIDPGGPAEAAGLEAGDVLLAVGRRYVSSVDEVGRLLEELGAGEVVSVRILRVEQRRRLQLEGPISIR